MASFVKYPRGTRANLTALSGAAGLVQYSQYWVTDESRFAVATTTSTLVDLPRIGGSNSWSGTQTFSGGISLPMSGGGGGISVNQGGQTNVPWLTVTNLGQGGSGISMDLNGGGSASIFTSQTKLGIGTTNKGQSWFVDNQAYDPGTPAYQFGVTSRPDCVAFEIYRNETTPTADFFRIKNQAGTFPFRVKSDGTLESSGANFTGLLSTAASATGGAGFNLPHGAAPTSPANGDLWTTTAGVYARINGATVGPFGAGGAGDGLGTDGNKGDVTIGGTGTTVTINSDAVTFDKIQNTTVASVILGRGSENGAGDLEQITLGTGLTMNTATLEISGVALSSIESIANNTFVGNNLGSPAQPNVLDATEATAILNLANGTTKGLMSSADFTKLAGVAAGATANDTDANLRARSSHTGTQAISTILASSSPVIFGKPGSGAGGAGEQISPETLTGMLSPVVAGGAQGVMIGTDKTKLNGIATGATANSSDATLLARANHTGTQAVSTILAAATARFFGRITAAGGAGEELTGTQATTLIDVFTTTLKGSVPAGNALKQYLRSDASWQYDTRTIQITIDNNGVVLTTGFKGFTQVPFAGSIQSWTILGDQSGSIVIDLWKDTYANAPPTVADTITASAKPSVTTATKNTSSTLTGWNTTLAAGDVIGFNVDSVTSFTRVTLLVTIRAE